MPASSRRRPPSPPRPAVDEWGLYDPEQAGLAALFARLEARRRTPARVPGAEAGATTPPGGTPDHRDTSAARDE
ncbi:MAG: hypothetical protein AB7O67_05135 [Vicinamibacterales bacterium]